ncbi:MAG: hypothetical protein IKR89_11855 [Bacteroidaceae bacterium]|nr:hypothetical protein [Bacteroidaceae bacterium]
MMKSIVKILIIGVSIITPLAGFAQEKRDTISGFNAMDYLLQNRFRNTGYPFKNKSILDHTYVQVGVGASYIMPVENIRYGMIKNVHFALGKDFSPYNSFRIGVDYGAGHRSLTHQELRLLTGTLDYVFNLTSYIYGYNPMRSFEIMPTFGVGYTRSSYLGYTDKAYDIHVASQLRFAAGKDAFISIEPRVTLITDQMDHSGTVNWHGIDMIAGGLVNYTYYFKPLIDDKTKMKNVDFSHNYFVGTSMGMQIQNISGMNLLETSGATYGLSFGKLYENGLGFRFSTDFATNNYRQFDYNNYKIRTTEHYIDLRAEVLVNPVAFFVKKSSEKLFGTNVALGAAFGRMHKYDYDGKSSFNYFGYTTGLQGWVRMQKGLKLFVEPRAMFVVDYYTPNEISTRFEKKTNVLYDFDLGLNMEYGSKETRNENRKNSFDKRGFVQLGAGIGNYFWNKNYNAGGSDIDANLSFAYGYRFSQLHGFKAVLSANRLAFNQKLPESIWKRDGYFASLSVNYMFNMLNALQLYDPNRRFDVDVYGGPVAAYIGYDRIRRLYADDIYGKGLHNTKDKRFAFGGQVGLQLKYALSDQFGLFVAPEAMLIAKNSDNTIFSQNINNIFRVNAGVDYSFADGEEFLEGLFPSARNEETGLFSKFFLEYGMGASVTDGTELNKKESFGPTYHFALGKWFSPVVAMRLKGYGSWNNVKVEEDNKFRHGRMFGGADLVFNPLGASSNYKFDSPAGFSIFAGPVGGFVLGKNGLRQPSVGVNAGLQGWVRLQRGISLFVEPTLERYTYKYNNTRRYVNSLRAIAGIRMDYQKPSERASEGRGGSIDQKYVFGQFEGGLAYRVAQQHFDCDFNRMNADWGMSLGYRFSNLSAIRGSFNVLSYNRSHSTRYIAPSLKKAKNTMGVYNERSLYLYLDYMFNMNTFMRGYANDDKFDVFAYAGPGLQIPMRQSFDLNCADNENLDLSNLEVINKYEDDMSLGFRAGLLFNWRLTSKMGLYYSPEFRVHHRRGEQNSKIYTKGLEAILLSKVGVSYRFGNNGNQLYTNSFLQHQSDMSNFMAPAFFECSTGLQNYNDGEGLKGKSSTGQRYTVAVGKWLAPFLGLKASGTVSESKWNEMENVDGIKTTVGSFTGRVSLMVNPFALSENYSEDTPVGVNLTFGPEFGHIRKYEAVIADRRYGWIKGSYQGWYASAQLWARCSRTHRFFIEPFYSKGKYDYQYRTITSKQSGVNAGVTVDCVGKQDRNDDAAYYKTGFFAQLSIGDVTHMKAMLSDVETKLHPAVNLDLGYRFNTVSGLRFGLSYDTYESDKIAYFPNTSHRDAIRSKQNYIVTSLAYQMNVSNFLSGTDKERKVQLDGFVGPALMFPMEAKLSNVNKPNVEVKNKIDNSGSNFGVVAGMQLSYDLSEKVSLNVTPEVDVFQNNKFRFNGNSHVIIMKTSVGLEYKF